MCSLKLWHGVFKNNSKEKNGILKADRLRDALGEVGFQLNSAILSVLMMRYIRKDGTLRFGDFVAIILNLSIAFGKLKVPYKPLFHIGRKTSLLIFQNVEFLAVFCFKFDYYSSYKVDYLDIFA